MHEQEASLCRLRDLRELIVTQADTARRWRHRLGRETR
jgi:hypothetical protein